MNYDVTIKTLPERYAATVQHDHPPLSGQEGMVWQALWPAKPTPMHLVPRRIPCLLLP